LGGPCAYVRRSSEPGFRLVGEQGLSDFLLAVSGHSDVLRIARYAGPVRRGPGNPPGIMIDLTEMKGGETIDRRCIIWPAGRTSPSLGEVVAA